MTRVLITALVVGIIAECDSFGSPASPGATTTPIATNPADSAQIECASDPE